MAAVNFNTPFYNVLPEADGTFDPIDKAHIVGQYGDLTTAVAPGYQTGLNGLTEITEIRMVD
jgi:hypothetical protein